jgi:hypothetical protein
MSQEIWDNIVPSTTSGNQLAGLLNDFKSAVVSGFSGVSRPSQLEAGGYWIDTTDEGDDLWYFRIYDGSQDITIFTLNLATGAASIANADTLFEVVKISNDTIGAILNLYKKRTGLGQVLTGDTLGELQFSGTKDDGVEIIQARIRSVSTNNATDSNQGANIIFDLIPTGSASIAEVMRLTDGKVAVGMTAPEDALHVRGTGVRVEQVADSATAPKLNMRKKRVAASGQVTSGDGIGTIDFLSTDNTGTERSVATIEASATETHTTTAQGSKITVKTKKATESAFTTQVEIADEVTIKTNLTVDGNLTVSGTTTTLNTATLDVEDANVTVNKNGTQATANSAKSGFKVEMSDATDAQIGYDSTKASKFVAGDEGSESEIITATHTQTMTNKTMTSPVLNTASIVSPSRADVKKDTLANLQTYAASAADGQLVFATDLLQMYQIVSSALAPIGGSTSGINHIDNPDAEQGTTGYDRYANTVAAVTPETGTGGSPNAAFTFTSSSSSPLRGTKNFLITKDANNRQGHGISYDFSIDAADKAQIQKISFDYETSSSYADGDIRLYVYDVTNAVLIDITNRDLAATAYGKYVGEFQTSSNSTSYRLILHVSSTNAGAYTVKFDNVFVGPQVSVKGPIVTDWISFTPTGDWVSNSTYTGKYRRVGDCLEGDITVDLTGAPTAAILDFTLPSGLSVDTNKMAVSTSSTGTTLGVVWLQDADTAANNQIGTIVPSSDATQVRVRANAGSVSSTVPFTWATGDRVRAKFTVPILGWSSNVVMSEDAGNRQISALARGTTGVSITSSIVTIPFDTEVYDTSSSYEPSTGIFTCPETGYYDISWRVATANISQSTSQSFYTFINRSGSVGFNVRGSQDWGAGVSRTFTSVGSLDGFYAVKGDLIWISAFSDVTVAATTSSSTNFFSVSKRSSPQTISSSDEVHLFVRDTVGGAIGTADTDVIFSEVMRDTHGAYNVSTGIFTCPRSGVYTLNTTVSSAAVTYATTNRFKVEAVVNGTGYVLPSWSTDGNGSSSVKAGGGGMSFYLSQGQTIKITSASSVATTASTSASAAWLTIWSK